jgi:fructose-1-phosphate kinase PfkB-like protein
MRELIRRGAGLVVTSQGEHECLALDGASAWLARPPAIEPGGSPMGAGDSLLAGLAAGLIEGLATPEALRLGVACGAASAAAPDTVLGRRPQITALRPKVQIVVVSGL